MNRQNIITVQFTILLLILLTTIWSELLGASQNSLVDVEDRVQLEELTSEQVGIGANDLIRKLRMQIDTEERYVKMLKTSSEEDRQVLGFQLTSLRRDSIKNVLQLADLLLKMEKKSPQPELRKQVEELIGNILPRLQHGIFRLRSEIDRIRAIRTEAKTDQLYTIEINVNKYTARLDELYANYLQFLKKMLELDMNTDQANADLVQSFYDRANELVGRISYTLLRIEELEIQQKDFPDGADITALIAASKKNLATNTRSLEKTLNMMDKLELDTYSFRDDLVSATKDFSSGFVNTGVGIRLAGRTLRQFGNWLVENGPKMFFKILVFLGIVFLFRLVARILRAGLNKALDKSKLNLSQLAHRMIVNTTSNMVMFFGVMIALSQFGFKLGPLLAGLGVAGFIIGFALQDTLGNFASGMMILLYRPYDVGNLVEAGGVFGKVHDMSLVSTSLLTVDNQLIVIPNSKIWGDVIKNITAQKERRIDMVFGIAYTDDIPKAEKVLEDILKSHDRVLDYPEPIVRLHKLGTSSVEFIVRPWVKVEDYWDVYWDVTRTVKLRFDEEGISIPFPQQDVYIRSVQMGSTPENISSKTIERISLQDS